MSSPREGAPPLPGSKVPQAARLVVLLAGLGGCQGLEAQFIGARVLDACDGAWSVCDTTVGCLLGDRSYVEGRFPGQRRVAVQLLEPSEVTVSFALSGTTGAGDETVVSFFEPACASRTRVAVTGRSFVGEADQRGAVSRSATLSGVGDHLIEVTSDAQTRYLLKVDVLPLRLKPSEAGR